MILVLTGWALPASADDDTAAGTKISSRLSLRLMTKMEAISAADTQGETDLPGIVEQAYGEGTDLRREKVFLYFTEQPTAAQLNELASLGVTAYPDSWIPPVGNHPAGFIIAEMPVEALEALAAKSYIVSLDTAEQKLYCQNDAARAVMGVDSVWTAGYTGKGVTVAVIDSGIDTTNPDFPPLNATNSRDYSDPDNLDDTIANPTTGHGTHVAGSLLGRGVNSATYKGVAPEADLVFLKVSKDDGSITSDAIVAAITAAVDIYHAQIISLSIGGFSQYHDGSDGLSQTVDEAVSKGATVFVSAGNFASLGWHYSNTIAAGGTIDIPVTVSSGTSTLHMVLVWSDGTVTHNNLSLSYYNSSHTLLASTIGGQSESLKSGNESISAMLNTAVGAGTYYLRVRNNSANSQFFHLYYDDADIAVKFSSPDPNYTVASPAEADGAIAVGATISRNEWTDYQGGKYADGTTLGSIASFSSLGPRVDAGAPGKPDIVAPGMRIISVRDPVYTPGNASYDPYIIDNDNNNLNGTGPADYFVMQGTSMACPIAAGVGALLLEKNPALTPAQVKSTLIATATDKGTAGFDTTYGWGLINAAAANSSLSPLTLAFSNAPASVTAGAVSGMFTIQARDDSGGAINVTENTTSI
jgi:subtilisin family serine protease